MGLLAFPGRPGPGDRADRGPMVFMLSTGAAGFPSWTELVSTLPGHSKGVKDQGQADPTQAVRH